MSLGATLRDLLEAGVARAVVGSDSVVVSGVRHDSRSVEVGDLFIAIAGGTVDGMRFVPDAVSRGAAAVLSERGVDTSVPVLLADDARIALAAASAFVYGNPTRRLDVVGITGTNGKTTTTYLVDSIVREARGAPAVVGTIGVRGPGLDDVATHTTPEADDLARIACRAVDAGATHLVMEVSSHALALHRVDGVDFDVVAFTNLTPDHLDFHGTMDEYAAAKSRLFFELSTRAAVINIDDPFGASLAERYRGALVRYSVKGDARAELAVERWAMSDSGLVASVKIGGELREVRSPLLGAYNLENVLCSLGCGMALGIDIAVALDGLSSCGGAPGRLERIGHPGGAHVFVDYAHTADALERTLAALRPLTSGRLFVVFGAGGDRDQSKRAPMGRASALGADVVVVTSDNPRSEDPLSIIEAIEKGIVESGVAKANASSLRDETSGYVIEPDRRRAIEMAIAAATAGDAVLIAGKGHERSQHIGSVSHAFDDRREAELAIQRISKGSEK